MMMQSMWGGCPQVKARVVCWNKVPCLIASFKASNPPQVWQMDLEKLTSYTLRLVEKEGEWDLGYAEPDDVFKSVAHFDERHDAECAYEAVQKALIEGGGIRQGASAGSIVGLWIKRLLILVGLVFVVMALGNWAASLVNSKLTSSMQPGPVASDQLARPRSLDDVPPDAVVLKQEPQQKIGVPVNADDILPQGVE